MSDRPDTRIGSYTRWMLMFVPFVLWRCDRCGALMDEKDTGLHTEWHYEIEGQP